MLSNCDTLSVTKIIFIIWKLSRYDKLSLLWWLPLVHRYISTVSSYYTTSSISFEKLLERNLTSSMIITLLNRIENELLDLQNFLNNLIQLNSTIINVTTTLTTPELTQPSTLFNCSSFSEFLWENMNSLKFRRKRYY